MKICMIVAIGKKRQIGLNQTIPWHVSEDFKHFKKTTMGHHMIMGRKNYEAIGKPLPGRTTILLSQSLATSPHPDVLLANHPSKAWSLAKEAGEKTLFITGGAEIYDLFLPYTHKLYLSHIDYDGEANVFFPEYQNYEWNILSHEKHHGWSLEILEKKPHKEF